MIVALAVLMLLHGIAHLPGFFSPWQLATLAEMPYDTTLLAGRLDVGESATRLLGLVWLATSVLFVVASCGAVLHRGWWAGVAMVAIAASLALCVLEWPAARIGVPVNLAIVAAIVLGQQLHLLDGAPVR